MPAKEGEGGGLKTKLVPKAKSLTQIQCPHLARAQAEQRTPSHRHTETDSSSTTKEKCRRAHGTLTRSSQRSSMFPSARREKGQKATVETTELERGLSSHSLRTHLRSCWSEMRFFGNPTSAKRQRKKWANSRRQHTQQLENRGEGTTKAFSQSI